MSPSLLEQVRAAKVPTASAVALLDRTEQRRTISWSVSRTLWFSLSQAELTRRRRMR